MEFERSRINAEIRRKNFERENGAPYVPVQKYPLAQQSRETPNTLSNVAQPALTPERNEEFARLHNLVRSIQHYATMQESENLRGLEQVAKRVLTATPHRTTDVQSKDCFQQSVLACPVVTALLASSDKKETRSREDSASIHATLLGASYFHALLASIDPGLARGLAAHHSGGRSLTQNERHNFAKFYQEIFRPGGYPYQILYSTIKNQSATPFETALLRGLFAPVLHLDPTFRELAPNFKRAWKEDGILGSLHWLRVKQLSGSIKERATPSWFDNLKASLRNPPAHLAPTEEDRALFKSVEGQFKEFQKYLKQGTSAENQFAPRMIPIDALVPAFNDNTAQGVPTNALDEKAIQPILLRIMQSSDSSTIQADLRQLTPDTPENSPAIDALTSIIASHSLPAVRECAAASLARAGIGNQYAIGRIRELLELRTDLRDEIRTELILSLSAIAAGRKDALSILLTALGDQNVPPYARTIVEQRLVESAGWNRDLLLGEAFNGKNALPARRILMRASLLNQRRLVELSSESTLASVIDSIREAGATTPEVINTVIEKIKRDGPAVNHGAALLKIAQSFPAESVPRSTIAQLLLKSLGSYRSPLTEEAVAFIATYATREERLRAASTLVANKNSSPQAVNSLVVSLISTAGKGDSFKDEIFEIFSLESKFSAGAARLLEFEEAPRWIKAGGPEMLPKLTEWIAAYCTQLPFVGQLKKVAEQFGPSAQTLGNAILTKALEHKQLNELYEIILLTGISQKSLAESLISRITDNHTPAVQKQLLVDILSLSHNDQEIRRKASTRAIEEVRDFVREKGEGGASRITRLSYFLQILAGSAEYKDLGPVIGGSFMQVWDLLDKSTLNAQTQGVSHSTLRAYKYLFDILTALGQKDVALASLIRNQIQRERAGISRDSKGISYTNIDGSEKLMALVA